MGSRQTGWRWPGMPSTKPRPMPTKIGEDDDEGDNAENEEGAEETTMTGLKRQQ